MRNAVRATGSPGLAADLSAIRRYVWLPVVAVIVAVGAALVAGVLTPSSSEARFRMNVVIDALPPLFGPPALPSPFDYARLATSDDVARDVANQSGVAFDQLKPRLNVQASVQRADIDFRVTGTGSRGIAHAWQEAFQSAAAAQTPALERAMTQQYTRQLDEARAQLERTTVAAKAAADDPALQQQVVAAQENYETAAKLVQSYDVVANTMTGRAVTSVSPYTPSRGTGSTAGRLGAAVAVGLLAGIIGTLLLNYVSTMRTAGREALEPIDARPAFRKRSER